MGQITVFTGPERHRRWSEEERVQILTEASSPGACVAEVARGGRVNIFASVQLALAAAALKAPR